MLPRKTFGIKRASQRIHGKPLTPSGRLKIAPARKKRRTKGEITKLKESLWQLCREIQIRKYGRVCYTCDKSVDKKSKGLHLGHYITSSLCSIPLRYDLRNLRPQCYHCNINLSGNWVSYQPRIEEELGYGITRTLLLENVQTKGKVYPKEWFEAKIQEYEEILK